MSTPRARSSVMRRSGAALTFMVSASLLGATLVAGTTGAGAATTTSTTSPGQTTRPVTTSAPPSTTPPPATTFRPAATTSTSPCVTLSVIRYAPGQVVARYDFEQGILPATFFSLNGAVLNRDPAAAHSGSYGLKITGLSRTAGLTLTLPGSYPGAYRVMAWVRPAPGEPARQVLLRMRDRAVSAPIGPNAWTGLDGYYSPETFTVNACGGPVTMGRDVVATLTMHD